MKFVTEGQKLLLKYLEEHGYKIVVPCRDPHYVERKARIYAPDNDATVNVVASLADCMCGKCITHEAQKDGAYVTVGVFEDHPATIWIGFTEDFEEKWERYDLHEPGTLEIIKGRIDWGLENWTPEKTKKPKGFRSIQES